MARTDNANLAPILEKRSSSRIASLLNIHIQVLARILNDVNAFELQYLLSETTQVGTLEAYLVLRLDDFFHDDGRFFSPPQWGVAAMVGEQVHDALVHEWQTC